jgi:hypothetical protein
MVTFDGRPLQCFQVKCLSKNGLHLGEKFVALDACEPLKHKSRIRCALVCVCVCGGEVFSRSCRVFVLVIVGYVAHLHWVAHFFSVSVCLSLSVSLSLSVCVCVCVRPTTSCPDLFSRAQYWRFGCFLFAAKRGPMKPFSYTPSSLFFFVFFYFMLILFEFSFSFSFSFFFFFSVLARQNDIHILYLSKSIPTTYVTNNKNNKTRPMPSFVPNKVTGVMNSIALHQVRNIT